MKHWTFTFRVEPPKGVMSVRHGGSVFFAAYSRVLDQWYLCANGSEEIIDEPQMLYLEEDYVRAHPRPVASDSLTTGKKVSLREEKPRQMHLF